MKILWAVALAMAFQVVSPSTSSATQTRPGFECAVKASFFETRPVKWYNRDIRYLARYTIRGKFGEPLQGAHFNVPPEIGRLPSTKVANFAEAQVFCKKLEEAVAKATTAKSSSHTIRQMKLRA